MSQKTKITYLALLDEIQHMLINCVPECRNIYIDTITVHSKRINGANWSIDEYQLSGNDNNLTECKSNIVEHIRVLRERYEVGPKPPNI